MLKLTTDDEFEMLPAMDRDSICVKAKRDLRNAYLELTYSPDFKITGAEYVLFPACCYKGNQFKSLKKEYPPMFSGEEAAVNMENTITDVPRLEKDGGGSIQVTAGDVSVPCVGLYSPDERKAVFVFTIQQIEGHNLGLSYEKGKIGITYPHMRKEKIYRWPFMRDGKDEGLDFADGQTVEIPYRVIEQTCADMEEFYRIFFKHRKCMGMDCTKPAVLPFERQAEIQIDKFNRLNWREEGGFYGVGTIEEPGQMWQLGWVGGGMSSYALMKLGGPLEWERGIKTLEHVFRTQLDSGLFVDECNSSGQTGEKGTAASQRWHLIRRSGDILYFLIKHFQLMEERGTAVPRSFLEGTQRLTDRLVKIWEYYGQFGQFADRETGEIAVGGSAAGALIPGALAAVCRYASESRNRMVSACLFTSGKKVLDAAEQSAEMFYREFAVKGYTTGGPGDILQCPDSESAFALLESFVTLYEVTNKEKWLNYSVHMANFCSSWVTAYNYRFPAESEFARLDMKTVGSVFANVQNKHSAPGICTLSGDSLYKVYQWTKEPLYLELAEEIVLTISQYMSTDERPVYSWDVPKDASLLNDDSVKVPREKLPSGFICERVNLSDWESERCIGGVFNGSCWAETSNLLALAEAIPLLGYGRDSAGDVWFMPDEGKK